MKSFPFVKSLLALCFAVIACQAIQAQDENRSALRRQLESLNVSTDTDNGIEETTIRYKKDGHRYRILMTGKKIRDFYLDDRKLDATEYARYEAEVKEILDQIEADRQQAQKHRQEAEQHRLKAQSTRQHAIANRETSMRDREAVGKSKKEADAARISVEKDKQAAQHARERAELDRQRAAIGRKKAEADRQAYEALLNEMITDKLVESKNDLQSFTLDKDGLMVNGKMQSSEISGRYKAKYLVDQRVRMQYKKDGQRGSMSID